MDIGSLHDDNTAPVVSRESTHIRKSIQFASNKLTETEFDKSDFLNELEYQGLDVSHTIHTLDILLGFTLCIAFHSKHIFIL